MDHEQAIKTRRVNNGVHLVDLARDGLVFLLVSYGQRREMQSPLPNDEWSRAVIHVRRSARNRFLLPSFC